MGLLDGLKKLTQPYDDDDDDIFEGADQARKSEPVVTPAQMAFEDTFAAEAEEEPEPANAPEEPRRGGFFETLGLNRKEAAQPGAASRPRPAPRPMRPARERTVNFGGSDTQVILFNPKSFEEAGELVGYLTNGRSLVMTLEGQPTDRARRLLDFISGITFALDGKVTPVAGKTYFITPQNVDLVAPQGVQPESDGQYF